ncbi:MAG: peptidylprolyl isomerase [Nanoarchaeota archaeon]|nr:peptidylprolyl isomerase [Nanoarchaeota archaeon]MBU1269335.1 peptidylprolyl isomerase [Nanoarchaeota archaeon]MBU1604888.1 peptidylprolyl isomerase [Nanoarchaeota archaeon]MBU2443617.1 peptidylprolyl isomerase [Nanoarchaeota archaeon]
MPAKKSGAKPAVKKEDNKSTIKKGDKVKVEYEGSFDDGTVFDSSKNHGKPLEFEVGASKVIKGFEDAMIGMKKGEEKKITLKPVDAYGDYNPELVKEVPKEQLPKDHELKPGMILLMGLPNGVQVPVKIAEVNDKTATLDLNHPLAGKTLNFKLKVLEISA